MTTFIVLAYSLVRLLSLTLAVTQRKNALKRTNALRTPQKHEYTFCLLIIISTNLSAIYFELLLFFVSMFDVNAFIQNHTHAHSEDNRVIPVGNKNANTE